MKTWHVTTYFQATDEEGLGQSTSVQLKITLTDSNDNAPVFQSKNYTAVIEEGAKKFEPAFYIKVGCCGNAVHTYNILILVVKGSYGLLVSQFVPNNIFFFFRVR